MAVAHLYFDEKQEPVIRIISDDDMVMYFRKLSLSKKQGYQTLMNQALRKYIQEHDKAI